MTNLLTLEAEDVLSSVASLRRRVRVDRDLHWFPLALFAALTLASAPLYYGWRWVGPTASSCHSSSGTAVLTCGVVDRLPPSGILTQGFTLKSLGGWLSAYWIVGLVAVSLVLAQWYRARSQRIGLKMHRWPLALTTLALIVIAWIKSSSDNLRPPFFVSSHVWSAGATPLWMVVIALGILVWQDRSAWSIIYATGLVVIVWAVSVYPAAGFLRWDGLGGWVTPANADVYTVILPGVYLAMGAFFVWARLHDQRRRLRREGHVHV